MKPDCFIEAYRHCGDPRAAVMFVLLDRCAPFAPEWLPLPSLQSPTRTCCETHGSMLRLGRHDIPRLSREVTSVSGEPTRVNYRAPRLGRWSEVLVRACSDYCVLHYRRQPASHIAHARLYRHFVLDLSSSHNFSDSYYNLLSLTAVDIFMQCHMDTAVQGEDISLTANIWSTGETRAEKGKGIFNR